MPYPAYLSIPGVTDGALTKESVGDLAQSDHADESLIVGFDHTVCIPANEASGNPTGNRKHMAMKLTKVFDKASPLLYDALCTAKKLDATVNWFRMSDDGKAELYFKMIMTQAVVTEVTAEVPNLQDAANANFGHLEHVSIRYNTIEWRHEPGTTSAIDSWSDS